MSLTVPNRIPRCYGLLYDPEDVEACQHCLLNSACKEAQDRPREHSPERVEQAVQVPNDKKLLILAVCHKYGIPTVYVQKKDQKQVEVTAENIKEFYNLDFLITSRESLERILKTQLV